MRKEEDYYALVIYRGRKKYYHITGSLEDDEDGYDMWISHIDYKPEREYDGTWIKNSKDKVIEKFYEGSEEYKYFKELQINFNLKIEEHSKKHKKQYNLEYEPFIGTLNVLSCYKKALKETPNPLNIQIYPKNK